MTIRVLHLRSSAGFFGAERVIMTLMSRSAQSGIDSHLACIENYVSGDQSLYLQAKSHSYSVTELPCQSRIDKQTIKALIAYCENNQIQLIHSHDYKSHFYALMASRKTGIPYVATLHGRTFGDFKNRIFELLENYLLKRAQKIIVVSEILEQAMHKAGMGKKTSLIENGVDELGFNPENDGFGKSYWKLPEESFVFGTVARFSQEKGHSYLLYAFKDVLDKKSQARLLLVGDGPLYQEIQDLAKELAIDHATHFAGTQTEIEKLLQDFDAYVSPSLTEGMPMSILEAMASNLPIIATNVGSLGDVLADGCGKLIAPGEAAPLAESMIKLIEQKEEVLLMGKQARQRVEQLYSAARQSDRYAEIYSEAL